MAYAETAVLHDGTYTPAGPSTEYGRRVRPVDANASTSITVIQHDDTDPVPEGGAGEIERWQLSVSAEQARKLEIRRAAEKAMTVLQGHIDQTSWTNAQAVDAIQYHARVLRRLVRLTVGLYDGTD